MADETPPRPPGVQPFLTWLDLPPEALLVAGRVPREMWRPWLELIENLRAHSWHGRVRMDLVVSYGRVTGFAPSIVDARPGRGGPKV